MTISDVFYHAKRNHADAPNADEKDIFAEDWEVVEDDNK